MRHLWGGRAGGADIRYLALLLTIGIIFPSWELLINDLELFVLRKGRLLAAPIPWCRFSTPHGGGNLFYCHWT